MKRRAGSVILLLCLVLGFALTVSAEGALTPDGNLKLVDDIQTAEKQIITVQSRGGSYYYIIIDRSGEEYNVHFLNAVDERDLFAIIKDDELLPECTCIEKCEDGHVDTECSVCSVNHKSCKAGAITGKTREMEGGSSAVPMLITFALAGGIAVFGWFCFKRKGKSDIPAPVKPDPDDDDPYEDMTEAPSETGNNTVEESREEPQDENEQVSEQDSEQSEEETEDEASWHYLP